MLRIQQKCVYLSVLLDVFYAREYIKHFNCMHRVTCLHWLDYVSDGDYVFRKYEINPAHVINVWILLYNSYDAMLFQYYHIRKSCVHQNLIS